ncbi:hypothetical protein PMAC_003248 [Pneumocystis sp. 'macacae']|nr:hypothetical protein PMAC_003248 [Pneumocystis sp. 'macacae']
MGQQELRSAQPETGPYACVDNNHGARIARGAAQHVLGGAGVGRRDENKGGPERQNPLCVVQCPVDCLHIHVSAACGVVCAAARRSSAVQAADVCRPADRGRCKDHARRAEGWGHQCGREALMGQDTLMCGGTTVGNVDTGVSARNTRGDSGGSDVEPVDIGRGAQETGVEAAADLWEGKEGRYEEVFNVSGNHDIGYAGEMTRKRVERWERAFGRVNGAYYFEAERGGERRRLRIVVLNTLSIDAPVHDESIRAETLGFLEEMGGEEVATVLLTHLPLYKHRGLCADPPYIRYYEKERTVREQNHLSENASNLVLTRLFRHRYGGAIITGHDHEGCDCIHVVGEGGVWEVERFGRGKKGIREITVRSMMGRYGGYSGVFSAEISERGEGWEFSYYLYPFVVNQVWWGIYICDFVVVFGLVFWLLRHRGVRWAARRVFGSRHAQGGVLIEKCGLGSVKGCEHGRGWHGFWAEDTDGKGCLNPVFGCGSGQVGRKR